MRLRFSLPALILAVLGIMLTLVYTPMRFTGLLALAGAGALLVWGLLDRRQGRGPRLLRRALALLVAAGLCVFAVLEVRIITYGRTDESREVSALVILGAGVNGTRPSLSLETRLEAALSYLAQKPDIPIVVSGSQGPGEEISEARCMADWLMDHGIPEERIILEEQADNTEENIAFSQELLADKGIDLTGNIAVVSSDYHLFRASLLWGTAGMVPVAAHLPGRYWPLTANYYIREAFAAAAVLAKNLI